MSNNTIIVKKTMAKADKRKNSGTINLSHFSYGIPARPSIAIKMPDVGIMVFDRPSPQVKANTATCRERPKTSAKGAIIGIVTAACPEPDGIKKLRKVWNKNMPIAATNVEKCWSKLAA